MIEVFAYIAKLYIGLALISYLMMKFRFWDECVGWGCFLKCLYRFLSILIVILFIAVKLKALDVFFIFSIFLLIAGVDFFLASKKARMKINFFKVGINQKIYDFLDGIINVKFKSVSLRLNFKIFTFILIFSLGLFLWMQMAIQSRSLFTIEQHSNLVKITSMLMNNYGYGIENFGVNSLCAFFSMILGVNQYVVLHLFGAFNFAILIAGVSFLTYKLSNDFFSVILSVSFFSFIVPILNFVSNPIEGSSFLLGLGWLLMVIGFWGDVGIIQKILGLIVAFFVDIFVGFTTATLVVLSELFKKFFESFRSDRVGAFKFILFVIFILLFLLGLEVYSRLSPEFGIKIYTLLSNSEVIAYSFDFLNVFILFIALTLLVEVFLWAKGEVESFKVFYGIFLCLLLIFTLASEKGLLSFLSFELFYPITLISSFVWLAYIIRKIFGRKKIFHDVFVVCVTVLLILNAFLHGGSKVESRIEPDEIVQVIQKIQKESLPFSFAIVSHRGSKAMVENWAWFMDWDYFVKIYILIKDIEKVYDVVYVIVPRQSSIDKIHPSFLPRIDNLEFMLDSACLNYKYGSSQIYFDGRDIKVYKLTKLKSD